jgi:hypothetical protein
MGEPLNLAQVVSGNTDSGLIESVADILERNLDSLIQD